MGCLIETFEQQQHAASMQWQWIDADRDLGNQSECAFTTDQQPGEV
jgi:hypothetical protein